jgi:homospermidine synthase
MVIEGAQGLTVDLRSKAADMTSSFVERPTTGAASGQKTSLLVTDDDAVGAAAFVVVINQDGQVIFKYPVVIGEN